METSQLLAAWMHQLKVLAKATSLPGFIRVLPAAVNDLLRQEPSLMPGASRGKIARHAHDTFPFALRTPRHKTAILRCSCRGSGLQLRAAQPFSRTGSWGAQGICLLAINDTSSFFYFDSQVVAADAM